MSVVRRLRGAKTLVYQRTDKYEEYSARTKAYVVECDRWLAQNADLVVYASRVLYEEGKDHNRAALLVPHAIDEQHFDRERALQQPMPEDLRGIPRPIVGFFGGIDDHTVDMALLAKVARELPQASLVLIGRRSADAAALAGLSNVHFLGKKDYAAIPAYGARFDVAIMPWNQNRWIHYCNPIKLKEYLALGAPVVSTDFPEVRRYRDVIRVATGGSDFVCGIAEALAGEPLGDVGSRRARVAGDSWDRACLRAAAAIRAVQDGSWPPSGEPAAADQELESSLVEVTR
jgi:glycosyltransferase involved in cell wall biosynthesis